MPLTATGNRPYPSRAIKTARGWYLCCSPPPFDADPNILDNDGFPPLYIPCERGFLHIVQILILFGADVNREVPLDDDERNGTANNRSIDMIENPQTDNDERTESMNNDNNDQDDAHAGVPSVATPLLAAILMQQAEIVKLLLENGANPNVVTDTFSGKKSSLEISREIVPHREIRSLLYKHGALETQTCRVTTISSASPNNRLPNWMRATIRTSP